MSSRNAYDQEAAWPQETRSTTVVLRSTGLAIRPCGPAVRHRHVPQRTDHQGDQRRGPLFHWQQACRSQVLWPGSGQSLGIETAYIAHGH